jgi:hypothetical protein
MPTFKNFAFGAVLGTLALHTNADIYMHNPRGSNDRNCERNVNRNNGNRLFDSQNNAKGGYACPRAVGTQDNNLFEVPKQTYYYEGSYIPIEWTNQHGCGPNGKLNCEIIIQYTCEAQLDPSQSLRSADGMFVGAPRDGVPRDSNDAATDTINLNPDQIPATNTENRRFGVHETLDYYEECSHRERNKGLFAADQKINRRDATGTRQNPNGNRRGLECPEERDYYPYWAPSPWIDIAVLSSNAGNDENDQEWMSDFCKYATTNSQNVKPVGYCAYPEDMNDEQQQAYNQRRWPNNERACDDLGAEWAVREPLTGIPPECMVGAFTRVNHLGNPLNDDGIGQKNEEYLNTYKTASERAALKAMPETSSASQYIWKVPDIPEGADEELYQNCVLRVRYNVSTADYPAYGSLDAEMNLQASITTEDIEGTPPPGWPESEWKVWDITPGLDSRFNGDDSPIQQDPYVELGEDSDEFVALAVNTNQYGRVFQDRSYNFAIKKRPSDIAQETNIFNVNVRGKRGNIVQVYPAVEYDFVPSGLSLSTGSETRDADIVHWQWTGSDYNPQRGCNDAEGGPPDGNNGNQNARADRTNVVELANMAHNYPFGGLNNAGDNAMLPILQMAKADPEAASEYTFFTDGNGDADPDMIKKMAFLNHKEELAAQGQTCLTQEELNNINNENQRDTNPRNCAKVNTAHPYFDGGLQSVTAKRGTFGFFSSRNNNFSNRDQTMGICVDVEQCSFTKAVGNPLSDYVPPSQVVEQPETIIEGDLIAADPIDNDGFGSGFKFGCSQTTEGNSNKMSDGEIVGIVFGSLLAGAAVALIGVSTVRSRNGNATEGVSKMSEYITGTRSSKNKSTKWMNTNEVI